MISMTLLELVGVAISYGLLKSIALRDGSIDFRAMFRDRMRVVNESMTKPFRDGFAANMIEAFKKRAASLDMLDGGEENDVKDAGDDVEEAPPPIYLENHASSLTPTQECGAADPDDTYISSPSLSSRT